MADWSDSLNPIYFCLTIWIILSCIVYIETQYSNMHSPGSSHKHNYFYFIFWGCPFFKLDKLSDFNFLTWTLLLVRIIYACLIFHDLRFSREGRRKQNRIKSDKMRCKKVRVFVSVSTLSAVCSWYSSENSRNWLIGG